MNRTLATMILTLSATFGATALNAQDKATANIPFAFQVDSKTMPAGKYVVANISAESHSLFSLNDWKGHAMFIGTIQQGQANPEDSKLTFACYAGKCILRSISLPGSSVSHSLKTNSTHSVGMASLIAVRVTR